MGEEEDKFYGHLQSIGIEGKKLGEEVGVFKPTGLNIDLITLNWTGGTTYSSPSASLSYIVRGRIGIGQDDKAPFLPHYTRIEKIQEGPFLRKKVTGLRWSETKWLDSSYVSNQISQKLNQDYQLNNYLLSRVQAGMPDITIEPVPKKNTPYLNVLMTVDSEKEAKEMIKELKKKKQEEIATRDIRNCLTIKMESAGRGWNKGPIDILLLYSTREDIEAFNTIAKHIKEVY